jgi:hypothetical protein
MPVDMKRVEAALETLAQEMMVGLLGSMREEVQRRAGALANAHAAATNGAATTANGIDMHCRFKGCQNRSGGPRFRYMCKRHRSKDQGGRIPLAVVRKAAVAYREARAT